MIAGIVIPTRLSQLADDTEHRTVTDTEKEKWNKPSITVDIELSDTSENPVQNKVIKTELDKKLNKSEVATRFAIDTVDSDKPISTKAVYNFVNKFYSKYELFSCWNK